MFQAVAAVQLLQSRCPPHWRTQQPPGRAPRPSPLLRPHQAKTFLGHLRDIRVQHPSRAPLRGQALQLELLLIQEVLRLDQQLHNTPHLQHHPALPLLDLALLSLQASLLLPILLVPRTMARDHSVLLLEVVHNLLAGRVPLDLLLLEDLLVVGTLTSLLLDSLLADISLEFLQDHLLGMAQSQDPFLRMASCLDLTLSTGQTRGELK